MVERDVERMWRQVGQVVGGELLQRRDHGSGLVQGVDSEVVGFKFVPAR